MWMPPQTTLPPGRDGAQRERDEAAVGREDDRGVERLRRRRARRAGPRRAELAGERLRDVVAVARERVDLAALRARDLDEDVRGRTEAVEAEAPRVAAHPQAAVADEARAQQRGGLVVREAVRDREAEPLVGHRVLGEAAVDVAAGEARAGAEVLAAAAAVRALAARPSEPRDADTPAVRLDAGDDLVAEDARRMRDVDLAVEEVQVGAADAAGEHPQQELARTRLGHGHLREPQWRADALEEHRPHAAARVGGHVSEIRASSGAARGHRRATRRPAGRSRRRRRR